MTDVTIDRLMDEASANVTTASLRSAASVCRLLAQETSLPSAQHGRYLAMAARLESIAEYREQDDSSENTIPIPPEAMSEDAFEQVVEFIDP